MCETLTPAKQALRDELDRVGRRSTWVNRAVIAAIVAVFLALMIVPIIRDTSAGPADGSGTIEQVYPPCTYGSSDCP